MTELNVRANIFKMGEKKGRGKQRNMNRGLMGTDNGGTDCGNGGSGGERAGRPMGKKAGQL